MKASRKRKDRMGGRSSIDDLLRALLQLDLLLEKAVTAAQASCGPGSLADPFRGLHIGSDEIERLLDRKPGEPHLQAGHDKDGQLGESIVESSKLARLKREFGLSAFDVDLLLIALAPELDLRYERIYAYLQDDVTRKRPSVDLALNLLCTTAAEKIARRVHFAVGAPLFDQGLLHLVPDAHTIRPPLLAHYFKLDEQVLALLLDLRILDARLAPFCRLLKPDLRNKELAIATPAAKLSSVIRQARDLHEPLRFYFRGPEGTGKRRAAEAVATECGASLLVVDLSRHPAGENDFAPLLRLAFREAWFREAIVYVEAADELILDQNDAPLRRFTELLVQHPGITILSGTADWKRSGPQPTAVTTVPFSVPDFSARRKCWLDNLTKERLTVSETIVAALADRFCLTFAQIAEAIVSARNQMRWETATPQSGSSSETAHERNEAALFAAARVESGKSMGALALKIQPVYSWKDIVLPAATLVQLRELCQRVVHRQQVLGQWGFDRKLSLGKGVNALFAGPSGTGKTMAAEIVANELGLDLYKIDLSGVVSKYIGETEKNLDRVFTIAAHANAILFFDEADALFGKRSEVRDSHDRYANLEISYLLQKMEQYEGVAILATNLRQNLDDSFARRLTFAIHFPFPGEEERLRIWRGIWPAETPRAALKLDFFAGQFKLSGGSIKNIALAAAHLAAADGGVVTTAHLLHATQREYAKLGRNLSAGELSGATSR